jgi:hypothetical protein
LVESDNLQKTMVLTINPVLSCKKMSGFPVGAVGVIDGYNYADNLYKSG